MRKGNGAQKCPPAVPFIAIVLFALPLSSRHLAQNAGPEPAGYREFLIFHAGYGSFGYRDVASIDPRMNASPTQLAGKSASFSALLRRERKHGVRQIGVSLDVTGNFQYANGKKALERPNEDRCTELKLRYDLDVYLLQDALARNLAIGIGPHLELGYRRTQRHFSPDILTRTSEGLLAPSFVISVRYCPFRFFQFKASAGNGVIAGLASVHHSHGGSLPGPKVVLGWTTDITLSSQCRIGKKLEAGLHYTHMDQGTYRMIAIGSLSRRQFGVSLGYSTGGSR